MIIEGDSISQIYNELLWQLTRAPNVVPRGMRSRELIGVQLRLTDARNNVLVHPVRDLNYRFMVVEWLWILTGQDGLAPLTRVNSQMARFSDDGETLAGAYGPRWYTQVLHALNLLRIDQDSRQAIVCFWKNYGSPAMTSKDVPCTLSYQFLIRDKRLHALVNMRSSDTWFGIPYDVFNFTMLLNWACAELRVSFPSLKIGSLILTLGSSHLYDEHTQPALQILLANREFETLRSAVLETIPLAHISLLRTAINGSELREFTHGYWRRYLDAALSRSKNDAYKILKEIHNDQDNN